MRSEVTKSRWPTWFKHAWRVLPPQAQTGIASASYEWFASLLPWLSGQGGASAVYLLFGNAGTYVGKANLTRTGKAIQRPGLPDRLVEHMVGLLFPRSRDGQLPRYKVLRASFPSVSWMPIAVFESEARCLAMERALIVCLRPVANRADWVAYTSKLQHGVPLRPEKAGRRRPPPALRYVSTLEAKTSV